MHHEVVCADCGINVPWEDQYCVRTPNGDTKVVCGECAKMYGFNLNDKDTDTY